MAATAGVSVGTVSNVVNRPAIVEETTRNAVTDAMDVGGCRRPGGAA
ncbi:LacI family DNA-binding transcriptional regulator [Catelliglobosispora koreensis]|nr:LacI family DNA-binding transcriptional regulator [Catelliglobosispora koreensis]